MPSLWPSAGQELWRTRSTGRVTLVRHDPGFDPKPSYPDHDLSHGSSSPAVDDQGDLRYFTKPGAHPLISVRQVEKFTEAVLKVNDPSALLERLGAGNTTGKQASTSRQFELLKGSGNSAARSLS